MHRDFSVRVPRADLVSSVGGQPRDDRDADVRAKTLYALAEWRGRRERTGQPKLVTAAINTLRSVGRHERRDWADLRGRADLRVHADVRARTHARARGQADETDEMT